MHFIRASFTSSLTEERFKELNKDDVIGKEQRDGKGIFNDGIKLVLFGFSETGKVMFEILAEDIDLKKCKKAYRKFLNAYANKFNEELVLDIYSQGFTEFRKGV
jgi:hypothetical protein